MYGIKFCGKKPFYLYYDSDGLQTSDEPTYECIWEEESIDYFLSDPRTDTRYKKVKFKLVEEE